MSKSWGPDQPGQQPYYDGPAGTPWGGQQPSPPRQRSGLRTFLLILGGLILLLIVLSTCSTLSSQQGGAPLPPASAPGNGTVSTDVASNPNGSEVEEDTPTSGGPARYGVTGGGRADITYTNATGGQDHKTDVPLPFYLDAQDGYGLSVTAQRKSSKDGEITCTVSRPGRPDQTSTSSGPYAVCSASGGF